MPPAAVKVLSHTFIKRAIEIIELADSTNLHRRRFFLKFQYNNGSMSKFDYNNHVETLVPLLKTVEGWRNSHPDKLVTLVKKYPKPGGEVFSKEELVRAYRSLAGKHGLKPFSEEVIAHIRMKPVRTVSGVAPVTVLTKPFPCPGKCIFCPNDIRMPKSYLADEPGAQRAERNWFDPYLQTYTRLESLHAIGHKVDKVELIILGGTWSYYPEAYQIWFIKECFRALNDFGKRDSRPEVLAHYHNMQRQLEEMQMHAPSNDPTENARRAGKKQVQGEVLDKTYNQVISELYVAPERLGGFDQYQAATWEELEAEQKRNETATCRNVGLVIETRPDNISWAEVVRIRRLGCTKAQIGVQSLTDSVLAKNKRGHDVAATRAAFALLRLAGFKIHAHWMANLHGSSVENDIADYQQLFDDEDFHPDELKIYPCSLIGSAELMQYYQKGLWKPYTHEELLQVLSACITNTPEYCRLTRIVRDIPSTDIVEGNKLTNFRQIVEQHLKKVGRRSLDIRAREIRGKKFEEKEVRLETVEYQTSISRELFLQYVVPDPDDESRSRLLAFLRLSLPKQKTLLPELEGSAMIREIHVYGRVAGIGEVTKGKAQHLGLGAKLIKKAKEMSATNGYKKLAVISAIGTREYYRKHGFEDGELYQFMTLRESENDR